ncbi:Rpn family recombination-promoting nuclease/putative transposase [Nocardia carnea]|uniref:Rpn family recombination-promoting nuclease/putative transposase n=1 Tax=Nocardia carnea TaxID=37328 RepID=A0ABW7TX23_9NOCA|nr:Rpn family recombination-promoting nuclease/putative transposase [Nocardia carnea]
MTEQRSNPHDAYFRKVMSCRDNAASEIRAALSPALIARLDLTDLRPHPSSFVHPDLANRYSDLLYRTRLDGHPAYIYILIEHQSSSDRFMAFRMLEYVVAIWRQYLTDNHRERKSSGAAKVTTLPAIIPLVVHNTAKGRAWSAPTELADLFDLDDDTRQAMGPYLPRFRFLLDDVAVLDPAALRARDLTPAARVLLVLQRIAPKNPALGRDMLDWLEDLRALESGPDPLGNYLTVLTYLVTVGETPEADLAAVFEQLGPRAKEAIVTTAEMIEARGKARGRAEALLEQMDAKFGRLPAATVDRVRSADLDRVRAWTTRILSASTLDELFA